MIDLAKLFRKGFLEYKTPRLRDRRGHYASGIMMDMRDQYWALTGEPETNPTDLVGHVKMWLGSSIEDGVTKFIKDRLHFFGLHCRGTQVSAGSSDPAFDCYLDALCSDRKGNQYVVEVKTKSGYGADLLLRDMEPSAEYLAQLGLYLRDTSKKGITSDGIFIYVPFSDGTVGDILFVYCRYNSDNGTIHVYKGDTLSGDSRDLNFTFDVGVAVERAKTLDKHLAEKTVPACEFPYKAKLTPEFLDSCSDTHLKMALKGEKILGHWSKLYSRYLNKSLEVDKETREYTADEIQVIREYYRLRHPKSKL